MLSVEQYKKIMEERSKKKKEALEDLNYISEWIEFLDIIAWLGEKGVLSKRVQKKTIDFIATIADELQEEYKI